MKRNWVKTQLFSGITLLLGAASSLEAEPRTLTSTDGKTFTAEILAIRGDQVVLSMGSKQYTLATSRFSEADQTYFEEWKAEQAKNLIPKLDVDISSGKSNRLDTNDQFDDRKGSFQFSIKVTNDERNFDLEEAKGILAVIGENCEVRNNYSIMAKSNFPLAVKEGETIEWQGDKFSYRFDDSEPARWGHQYYGYVFQVTNASGKVIFTKTLPKKFEGEEEKILAFQKGTAFDNEMKNRGKASIYAE